MLFHFETAHGIVPSRREVRPQKKLVMKNLLTLIIFLLPVLYCRADEKGTVKKTTDANITGHIILKGTGEHLPFLTVLVKGTNIGTATDESGHFFLKNLPLGKYTLRVQGVGYKSVEKEITLQKGKTQEVNFEIEEDVVMLEGAVVTANRNETDRREAPVVVNVLSPKLFENTNSVCLSQGLNFQPGLRVENNCQNCGFQQVRINGLDGPYSQILIDSRPMCSSLSGVYGLEQIPANMIDRVEVLRGGGSALFGANAIAGTINIITKEPLHNYFQVGHTLSAIDGDSFDNVTAFNGAIVNEQRNAGIHLFGMVRNRQAYDHDGDGFSELGVINSTTLGFRTYYKPTHFSKISMEYHHIKEFRRGGDNLHRPPHEANVAEQADHNIHGGGLNYTLSSKDYKHRFNAYTSMQNISRESYYGAGQDENAYGRTKDFTVVGGAQYSYDFDKFLFMPSMLTAGIEFSHNKLEDRMLGYNREINQEVNVYSAFLQNEWKTARFSFLLGGRLDKNSNVDDPIFSPRINVRYNPTTDINLRASYSEGFRAPQTYDEDLHVAAVGGEVTLIQVDPNLKTEKSRSYSASVDYYTSLGPVQINLLVEGFYTRLKNPFVLEEVETGNEENKILERRNGSDAKVKGINIEGRVAPHKSVQLQFGATFQSSKYADPVAWSNDPDVAPCRKLLRSPDEYGYATLNLLPFKNFSAALSGTYTGSMYVGHFAGYIEKDVLKKTDTFFDGTIKLAYDIKIGSGYTIQINGGVQNVFDSYQSDFDKGEFRDSGYIYGPGLPRTYFAGVKFGIF